MYRPPPIWLPPQIHITSASVESIGPILSAVAAAAPANTAWPANNRTIYTPFQMHTTVLAKRLFCLNGTANGTTTMGLYASDASHLPAARLASASAASSGSAAVQYFDITDTLLYAGRLYYVSLASSTTTFAVPRSTISLGLMQMFMFNEASNTPDPATPAKLTTAYAPLVGIDLKGTL